MNRTVSLLWKVALVAVVAAAVVYRVRFTPVAVKSQPVTTGAVVAETMGTGTLEARVQVTISPKISGLLTQVLADQGDRVTRGQLLATLDDGDLRQQVQVAQASLAAARSTVERAATDITRAEATAVLARMELTRVSQLRGSGAATAYEVDTAAERRNVAEAEIQRAKLAKVEAEMAVAKAQEALRYDQQRLSDTRIAAPFDALVIRRSREPGDVVVPGSPILQVISTDQMWISAWVDESAMTSLAAGQPVRVVFRSEPGRSYEGVVARLAPWADPETREFVVDVTVARLPAVWAVGQRAEVYIQTARKEDVVLAPAASVVWRDDTAGVYVDAGGKAAWRPVELGLRGERQVEVLRGLSPSDIVIWPGGAAALREGWRVTAP